jgi:exopolysaccharide biosynthesis polyprenyl glycosylphosphotransferase
MTLTGLAENLSRTRQILVISEVSLIFFVSVFVSWLRFDRDLFSVIAKYPGQPKILIYPILWYCILYLIHAWDKSIMYNSPQYYIRILSAGGQSLIAFAAIAYLIKFPISRLWIILNVIATTVSLIVLRLVMKRIFLAKFEPCQTKYLYIGSDSKRESYLNEFESYYGFRPQVETLEPPREMDEDLWLEIYENRIISEDVYGVLIGYGEVNDAALLRKMSDTQRSRVIDFLIVSRISTLLPRFETLDSPTLVRVRETSIISSGAVVKRLFDVAAAFTLVVVLSPLMIVVSILIKISSSGPVIYTDKRVGQHGQLFIFPKFRSMYRDSDRERHRILGIPDEKMIERYKKDPRITPMGRFIRRWSIDELPQLWCVLIGTMSMVGPRPILKEELSLIDARFKLRFIAKPGLTGLWQVTGRKEVAWEDRMLRDMSYIDSWSFSRDFVLILKTIEAVFSGRGAH